MKPEHILKVDGERIPYSVVRSSRRTLAITVSRDGVVTVRAPRWLAGREIARFAAERAEWIARKRAEFARLPAPEPLAPPTSAELAHAKRVLRERLEACWPVFARPGDEKPELRVRAMRSRWGSVTAAGRVTLNAHLLRTSPECIDYVVFHELCHLRVRGHGPAFYAELSRYVPEWKRLRREMRHALG